MNTQSSAEAETVVSPSLADMPVSKLCPCGGGQSCIVDRRWVGDWVHEDIVFKNAGLPIRKNCLSSFSAVQQKELCKNIFNHC